MSRGGPLIDSDTVGTVGTILVAGLLIGGAVAGVYQAGVDVSERILREKRKEERKFERKERKEQKEKKKEERRKERLEWWKTITNR